jgi:hypothetical protein
MIPQHLHRRGHWPRPNYRMTQDSTGFNGNLRFGWRLSHSDKSIVWWRRNAPSSLVRETALPSVVPSVQDDLDAHDPVIGRHPECLQECLLGCWNFEVFIACCLVSPVENILIHWYGQWHRATIEEKTAKKKHSEWKRRRLYFSSLNLEVFDRDIRQSMGDFWVTSLTSTISPNQIILTVKWSKYIKVSNLNDYIQIRQQSIKYHQLLLDQDQTTIRQYPSKMNAILLLPIFTSCYLWSIRASPMAW